MLKTLPITSHHLAICESNFLRLSKLLKSFSMKEYFFETINPDSSNQQISFLVLSKTRHTVVIQAKQITSNQIRLNEFVLRIQISLDAKLAEVTSYQGEKPIPFFIHKSVIQSWDEKKQQNRFLTEWLESIFISGIAPKSAIEKIFDD